MRVFGLTVEGVHKCASFAWLWRLSKFIRLDVRFLFASLLLLVGRRPRSGSYQQSRRIFDVALLDGTLFLPNRTFLRRSVGGETPTLPLGGNISAQTQPPCITSYARCISFDAQRYLDYNNLTMLPEGLFQGLTGLTDL